MQPPPTLSPFFPSASLLSAVSQPRCLSTICHLQLHQRLRFQNGAFLSAFVSWVNFFFFKKRHFHIREEKCESGRMNRGAAGERLLSTPVPNSKPNLHWSDSGVALVYHGSRTSRNYPDKPPRCSPCICLFMLRLHSF